jgi:hypothetical protein
MSLCRELDSQTRCLDATPRKAKIATDTRGLGERGRLSITIQHTQESLCLAHIYALAGMAGANYIIRSIYDYGVNGQFVPVTSRNGRRVSTGHPLDFQAKSSINWQLSEGNVIYDLEAKTYDDIVTRDVSERTLLLILLCLPRSPEEWCPAPIEWSMQNVSAVWQLAADLSRLDLDYPAAWPLPTQ